MFDNCQLILLKLTLYHYLSLFFLFSPDFNRLPRFRLIFYIKVFSSHVRGLMYSLYPLRKGSHLKKGSRNSRLTFNACTCRIRSRLGRARLNLPYPGKRVGPRARFLRKSRTIARRKTEANDKEEDEASRRRKGRNFRGGIAVAMHRLGQLDRDKLRTVQNGGEKPRGASHSADVSYTSVYLTGALMRERRDG